ncbi:MAG TPA: small ribosomal subunit Rsm22 family protein [Polyangia bacterium]|jgi:hypothetical protein|nr:small ribosomal subunit Rsm22 family protein [Polyangia bacterium]
MASPGRGGRLPLHAPSRIHEGLIGARPLVGTPYLADARLRQEYAAEIAPRTGAALAKILAELALAAPRHRRPRVLDLGAGTGAAGDAVRSYFAQQGDNIEMVAMDNVQAPGVVMADLAGADVPAGLTGRFDLIVAAHLLTELFVGLPREARIAARARKVVAWCERLLEDGRENPGVLIIVEPALRDTSRELLAVRDRVVATGLQVVAPCFWAGPCPALIRERDWCHDAVPAGQNRRTQPRVDFSYLVLRTQGEPATDPTLFRIVSDPLLEKGRLKFYGCGPVGRQPLIRLDRHRNQRNAAFDDLQRGDVARISRTTFARDGLRIVAETTVTSNEVPIPR